MSELFSTDVLVVPGLSNKKRKRREFTVRASEILGVATYYVGAMAIWRPRFVEPCVK
jgi:hypothetical protein